MTNYMLYDELPLYDDGWMLYASDYDEETNEQVLIGPCGDITHWQNDLPTDREQHASWARYWRHVMETGDDCLHQMYIISEEDVTEHWQFAFVDSIVGIFMWARKNGRGKWLSGFELPVYVKEYLEAEDATGFKANSLINRDAIPNINALKEIVSDSIDWGKRSPTSIGKGRHEWAMIDVPHKIINSPSVDDIKSKAKQFFNQYIEEWEYLI